jgi:hypothetical protein
MSAHKKHFKFIYDLFLSLKTFISLCHFQSVHYLQLTHLSSGANIYTLICPPSLLFSYPVISHPYIYWENECSPQCSNLQVSHRGITDLWPDLPLWICTIIFRTPPKKDLFCSVGATKSNFSTGILFFCAYDLGKNGVSLLGQLSKSLITSI